MKSKFNRKPLKILGFETKGHVFVGIIWPVVGSSGNNYEVEMQDKGFTCNCTGFTMHGKCKHINYVHSRIIDENVPLYR